MSRSNLQIPVTLVLLIFCLAACAGHKDTENHLVDAATATNQKSEYLQVPENISSHFELEKVSKRVIAEELHLTGRIRPELGKETDVSTRFSGRVLRVLVKPGEIVHPGQTLALIDSHELSSLQAELIEAQSKLKIAEAHQEREKQIYEENLQRPKSLIGARTRFEQCKVALELCEADHGRIEGLWKAKIAAQKDYLAINAALAKCKLEFKEAQAELAREEGLFKNRALLRRDLQLAEAETQRELKHFHTLQQRLEVSGLSKSTLKEVLTSGKIMMTLPVKAGVNGVVTKQDISVGELVGPDKLVFTITDMSKVSVVADLPEAESSGIKVGDQVKVRIPSMPDEVFYAPISYVADMVSGETRTVPIRATLDNSKKTFKINMFADIELKSSPKLLLTCPKNAVHEKGSQKVVYIKEGESYKEKRVELGIDNERYFEVVSGLKDGDQVVTQGSLMLRTEMSFKQ